MKKKSIIITITAVIVIAAIVATVVILNNLKKPSETDSNNPATVSEKGFSEMGTLTVSNETATAGDNVEVVVSIKDNPGILGMSLKVNYMTNALTLIDAKSGDAVNQVLTFTKPGKYQNNCKFLWDGMEISDDQIKDGDVLVLTFAVSDDAKPGDYPILVSYEKDDIVDKGLDITDLNIIDGNVTVE